MKFGQDLTSELCDLDDRGAEENHLKKLFGDARDTGSIPVLGSSPREENGYPLQYSCLGNPKDMEGYCPWDHKESNTMEQQRTHSRRGGQSLGNQG